MRLRLGGLGQVISYLRLSSIHCKMKMEINLPASVDIRCVIKQVKCLAQI